MTTSSRRTHLQFRYGQCLNDGCSKCKSKEIQEIPIRKDFVCEECGKDLREVPRPRTWWEKYGKTTSVAIAAVVVIGGGVAFFASSGSDSENTSQEVAVTDSLAVASADTVATQTASEVTDKTGNPVEETSADVSSQTQAPVEKAVAATTSKKSASAKDTNGASLKCGKYEGPMAGGKPDGIGGVITVTRSYTIDLKDGSGNSVSIEAGDRISNTKFKNGVLQQGQLIRSNGERKFLTGLAEHL